MSRIGTFAAALASILIMAGCGDDDPIGPEIADLAGSYNADQFRYTSTDDPDVTLPLILAGGSFSVDINNSGGFLAQLMFPGASEVPLGGDVSLLDENTLSIEFDEQTRNVVLPQLAQQGVTIDPEFQADFTLVADTLTWTVSDVEVDFDPEDGDPTELPATLEVVLIR